MQTPENNSGVIPSVKIVSYVVDYERCTDLQELRSIMETINRYQYDLVSVTQDSNDVYTVFFRRCVIG